MKRFHTHFFALGLVVTASSCSTDADFSPPTDIGNVYWSVRLNHNAIILSTENPYNSVQLEAVPHTPDDVEWEWDGAVEDSPAITTTWFSTDSSKVRVTSDGLLTARAVTTSSGVNIIVRKQIKNITHLDTARVVVTSLPDPPRVKSLSMDLADSSKRASGIFPLLIPTIVTDSNNSQLIGIPVTYRTSNTELTKFNNKWTGSLSYQLWVSGNTNIIASSYVYGVSIKDSLALEIGYPLSVLIGFPSVVQTPISSGGIEHRLRTSLQEIGPGGEVFWENSSGVRPSSYTGILLPAADMSVVFDDPSNVLEANGLNASGEGNIDNIPGDPTLSVANRRRHRRFTQPGEYRYTIQPWGFRGTVIVHEK